MSSAPSTLVPRAVVVWSVVTLGQALSLATVPATWQIGRATGSVDFADLLVAGCAIALLLALLWLWLVTTVTVAELLIGRPRAGGGTTRRLVLLACGAAALACTTAPALASDDGASPLVGLSLPDRGVTTGQPQQQSAAEDPPSLVSTRTPLPPRTHVVRTGESLWSIAQASPGSGGDVERRWREIWAANRAIIGSDPDLILPGQQLRIPADTDHTDTDTDTEIRGDRR